MSEQKITKQLDYSTSARVDPEYRLHRIPPKGGTEAVTLTTAGGAETEFDLPQRVFNLSRSTLSFNAAPPASGANTYNYQQMDALSYVQSIKLSTESGLDICDISFLNNMTKIVWKPETQLEKFLTFEGHDNGTGAGKMFQPCRVTNKLKLTDSAAEYKAAFVDGAADLNALAGALTAAVKRPDTAARRHDDAALANGTGNASAVSVAFTEPKYFSAGTSNNASPALKIKINLGMIYNSIFEVDKDIMFDKITTIKITWAPTTKIYYFGTDPLSPGGGVITAAAGNVTISSLYLYIAMEQNQNIINAIKAKVAAGSFTFLYPNARVYRKSINATGAQSITRKFNRTFGLRLQRVYHAAFSSNEEKSTAYDTDNRYLSTLVPPSARKIISYNTYLDTQALHEFEIKAADYEDYLTNQPKLVGSVIQNSDMYKYNWFHCEDFTGSPDPLWKKDHNREAGLDLTTERTFDINMDIATVGQHYTVFVFQRRLKVSSMETTIE